MVDFIHNNKELYGVEQFVEFTDRTFNLLPDLDLCDEKHCFAREHRAKRDLHDLHHAEEIKRIGKKVQVDRCA
ncbi:putative insB (plasmid) [Acinetobacter baumannii]|nr:putative insB [Acinetobacter baumannii]